jgi:hypothetical protein
MTVIEFYNRQLDHYFLSSNPVETQMIEAGAAGPGWERTGEEFDTAAPAACNSIYPVFRFYASNANSNFFTVNPAECGLLRRTDPGWQYEGDAFGAVFPVDGWCPPATRPVYRLYNNRWMFGDSNHRFVTRLELYEQMRSLGWTGEGVAFCAPGG